MINPNIPPVPASVEVRHAAMVDIVVGHDWRARFSKLGNHMRTLRTVLDGATDPGELIALIEMRGAALQQPLGAGVLACYKESVTAERAWFEVEFGEGQ